MLIHHDSILTLELPYRERLALRRTVFYGEHGSKAAVLAGAHGDELEGLDVCHRLAAWLHDLAATRPEALLGQVELFPAMNPLGLDTLKRLVPVYETDLNRNFPGHAEGPLPQRIAEAAMRHLRDAALVIDIHASDIFLREIPQVRINQTFADTLVPLAPRMNVDLIWLHGAVTVLEAIIAHSLNSLGVPCLSEVRSPVHGILFTLREYPLVYEGLLMARIMATDKAGEDFHIFSLPPGEGQGEGTR
jgi:predicted deacylase